MSLDYNLTGITDYETVCWTDQGMNPTTQAIIFGCITTGIGKLTAANLPEWYARYTLIAKLESFDPISIEDLEAHIGLHTNVFPEVTRAQWLKRLGSDLDRLKWTAQRRTQRV